MKWYSRIWLLVLLSLGEVAMAEQILFAPDWSHGLPASWENVAFFEKPTDYTVQHEGTNVFLHAEANDACSALSVKLNLPASPKLKLRWRWRIEAVNTNGSERELAKFDHAARVFVAFDTFLGPPRTLNYLWANVEPPGVVLAHPKTERAQLFVLESGDARAGRWVVEERDVAGDWSRAFPDRPMPKIVGMGVMTDSDSLGGRLAGDYADIQIIQ